MVARLPIPPLVARDLPSVDSLGNPALFAWEILRRRVDYASTVTMQDAEPVLHAQGTIEFLIGTEPDPPWGLQFRRRTNPHGRQGAAFLASRPRPDRPCCRHSACQC